jgi:hypothetical protein
VNEQNSTPTGEPNKRWVYRWFLAFARRFPTKSTAERVLPWVGALVTLCALVFALFQYTSNNMAERVARVVELHRAYTGSAGAPPIYETWTSAIEAAGDSLDRASCTFIEGLVKQGAITYKTGPVGCDNEAFRTFTNTVELDHLQRGNLRIIVANQLRAFFEKNADTLAKKKDIFRALAFFHEVAVCVETNACDRDAADRFFAIDMRDFLNGACVLFESSDYSIQSPDYAVAKFVAESGLRKRVDEDNKDAGQESLFLCDIYRGLDGHAAK